MRKQRRFLLSAVRMVLLATILGLAAPGFSRATCPILQGCHLMAEVPCGAREGPSQCDGCPSNLCVYNCNGQLYEIAGNDCCVCT